MADFPTPDLRDFFSRMEDQGVALVGETPKFDLELYIQNYKGRSRFDRLLFIGKCCPSLSVDALKAAVIEAKKGIDTSRYREAWDCIRIAAPGEPEAIRDDAWITKVDQANDAETKELEVLLKGYKNNLIKESIRRGNEDLGRHYEAIGRLSDAGEAYGRMRQDVSTTKHIVDCGMYIANICIQRRDWAMALNNVGKIGGVQGDGDEDVSSQAAAKIIAGISQLGLGRLEDAAKIFIQAPAYDSSFDYAHIASPNDVAVYGGLLALATMNRQDLQSKVMDSQSFRSYLEYEPHIRKAIKLFINGRYANCLSILETGRNHYLLDMYIQKHVPDIYARIRSKCIVQYFVPFSCVTIKSLDDAFAQPGESVEDELATMIREGVLRARIDAQNKLLVAVRPDARLEMQTKALDAARKYELEGRERLRHMSIIAAGLEVVGSGRQDIADVIDTSWIDPASRSVDVGS